MKLTGLGKLLVMIVILGLAVGGYRFWQQSSGGAGIKLPGSLLGDKNTKKGDSDSPSAANTAGGVEIPFVITAAKKDWVATQIGKFNEANAGKYFIVAEPMPSREAMHAILQGKKKPVIWSPGSPIWPTRLAQAWREKHGNTIVNLSNPNGYRVYLRSPLVFLTTREKAKFLRPLLSSPQCWENIRKMSLGKIRTPFGPLNFSHADPLTSSSGMLTLGLIMYDYAQRTGQGGNLQALASSPKFLNYVSELERGLIYDAPAEKGTTALTNAFLEDPSHYDFITAYESAALAAADKKREIAVIYPSPTAVSEHAVSLLSADWVSDEQRAGAEAFLNFLGSDEAIASGIKSQFRPVQSTAGLTLANDLASHSAQGFQQSFAPIELPPYEALNTAAYQWRVKIAQQAP